jgi:hypothetical protein
MSDVTNEYREDKKMRKTDLIVITTAAILLNITSLTAQSLENRFKEPPPAVRPYTWWHWLNGNITKDGITADLESIKAGGLAGCYLFNCGGQMPQGDVRFMQPEWQAMFKHAIDECERLDLKFGVHNCDGFSQSGGPWITPEKSMKQLTWSSATFNGDTVIKAKLQQPDVKENFYRDLAVIAFPLPEGSVLKPNRIKTSEGIDNPARLIDGDVVTKVKFHPSSDKNHRIDLIFDQPQTVRSLQLRGFGRHLWEHNPAMIIFAADENNKFHPIVEFTPNFDLRDSDTITIALDESTSTTFRILLKNETPTIFGEIELSSAAKVHFAEPKSTRVRARGHGAEAQQYRDYPGVSRDRKIPDSHLIKLGMIKNISGNMNSAGQLNWKAPPGRWRILRVGYTSNGHYVAPATNEGRGLECDKLDSATVRYHLDQYVGKLIAMADDRAGKTFTTVELDSWECAIQNWSAGLEKEFMSVNRCRIFNFMPTLLEGWIINDADTSERFLWSWRRFLADQISKNYFATAADYLKEKGMIYVGESNGRQQFLYDVAYSRNSAVPMGEFWLGEGLGQGVRVDNKLSSSVAHITGKKIIASESYTSGPGEASWQQHPFSLKRLGDEAFCAGINQFVFHTFAHQPYEVFGPGFTFFFWGLNYNRNNTWFHEVGAWNRYLSRCNLMLREGTQLCDVLWYVGEDVPNVIEWRDSLRPPLPDGYDFDGCDRMTLFEAKVDSEGQIVLPSGSRYEVLLLPESETMTPAIATRVRELLMNGARVLLPGKLPRQSPSISDFGEGDELVREVAHDIEGVPNLFRNLTFEELFEQIEIAPDFSYSTEHDDAKVIYVHRRTADADIYFVANQNDRIERIEACFRVAGQLPEIWDPVSGRRSTAAAWRYEEDRTTLDLVLERYGSIFVVFRRDSQGFDNLQLVKNAEELPYVNPPLFIENEKVFAALSAESELSVKTANGTIKELHGADVPAPLELGGAWQLRFPENHGAPRQTVLNKLIALSEHSVGGIRHFSGTLEYSKDFQFDGSITKENGRVFLDLGDVQVIARAELNGRVLATLWKPPYRVEISDALRAGQNELKIFVTTLWPNRMIGDASRPDNDVEWHPKKRAHNQLPAKWPEWLIEGHLRPSGRLTFCTRRNVYRHNDPLLPSGLIGPVKIVPVQHIRVD